MRTEMPFERCTSILVLNLERCHFGNIWAQARRIRMLEYPLIEFQIQLPGGIATLPNVLKACKVTLRALVHMFSFWRSF